MVAWRATATDEGRQTELLMMKHAITLLALVLCLSQANAQRQRTKEPLETGFELSFMIIFNLQLAIFKQEFHNLLCNLLIFINHRMNKKCTNSSQCWEQCCFDIFICFPVSDLAPGFDLSATDISIPARQYLDFSIHKC